MKEYRIALFVFVLVGGALIATVYFFESERERHQQIEETDHEVLDVESSVVEVKGEGELPVKLFFCASGAKGPSTRAFEIEERTILQTEDSVLNARQIVNEIMKSRGEESPRIFSEEARVRQIYLLEDGTASGRSGSGDDPATGRGNHLGALCYPLDHPFSEGELGSDREGEIPGRRGGASDPRWSCFH